MSKCVRILLVEWMSDLNFCVWGLFMKQIPGAGVLLFEPWPNKLFSKFDETYSIERLDVGLINECCISK